MITQVLNLATGQLSLYTLPASQAVIAAYENNRRNFNTWDYSSPQIHPALKAGPSGRTIFCGDFGAMIGH
jgi:hypothetical protein